MREKSILCMIVLLPLIALAQKTITISGYVKDTRTGEVIIAASVYNTNQKKGVASNNYGFFSLTLLKQDTLGLIISVVGYKPQLKKIVTSDNIQLNIAMEESGGEELGEVTVSAARTDKNIRKAQMSVIDVPMKQIQTLPAIIGERDVLKIIQLLPGVQAGHEGTAGFFVRGGNADQNLVQLDEATVYNPTHLFGLFSAFNTNALKNVTLIKGGFPAQYGGRLSSILDITTKEGNNQTYTTTGGIGMLTANIGLEGPIKKNKSSFSISGRRSYFDVITKPFIKKNANNTSYYFYDLNAKINFELGKKDHLFLSGFKGLDKALYTGSSSLNYGIHFGNATGTLRWSHLFSNKIFANTSIIYNDYHLSLSTKQGQYYAQVYSGIRDVNAKFDLDIYSSLKNKIKTGINYSYSTYFPATSSSRIPRSGVIRYLKPDSIAKKYSNLVAFYVNDEITFSEKFGLNLGIRFPSFFTSDVNYTFAEPRATLKYSIDPATSVKASYTRMNQFVHLVPSSTASLPTDIWITSSELVKPQASQQIALGLFKNFDNNGWETSIEVYYKTMKNQVLFKEGAQPLLDSANTNIENVLVFGKGNSYGLELFVKKNIGKLTGWISYTLSKTTQQFDSLNRGKPFPFTYDRRHNLNIVGTYELNKRWTFSADFVFMTGAAFTLPVGRASIYQDGSLYDGTYYDFTSRNNYRYRSYHRLDINAINKKRRKIFGKRFDSEWVFSIYNVYSRLNTYFIYLTSDPITKEPQAKQVTLLPVIPSISFNFKF
jgi:outer membrane receptor for ferrienterochelin and colicin